MIVSSSSFICASSSQWWFQMRTESLFFIIIITLFIIRTVNILYLYLEWISVSSKFLRYLFVNGSLQELGLVRIGIWISFECVGRRIRLTFAPWDHIYFTIIRHLERDNSQIWNLLLLRINLDLFFVFIFQSVIVHLSQVIFDFFLLRLSQAFLNFFEINFGRISILIIWSLVMLTLLTLIHL